MDEAAQVPFPLPIQHAGKIIKGMKVILLKAYFKAMSVVCGLQIKDNDDIQYFNENDRFLKAVIIFFQPQNVLSREEKGGSA